MRRRRARELGHVTCSSFRVLLFTPSPCPLSHPKPFFLSLIPVLPLSLHPGHFPSVSPPLPFNRHLPNLLLTGARQNPSPSLHFQNKILSARAEINELDAKLDVSTCLCLSLCLYLSKTLIKTASFRCALAL